MNLKLLNPTFDVIKVVDSKGKECDRLVIRGIIDPGTYDAIQADSYQREIIFGAKVRALMHALETSVLPDVELGMRGDRYQARDNSTVYVIQSEIYVIDGQQRLNAAKTLITKKPGAQPRIGALIHVDSTVDFERERFRILNQERSKLSPNVLLRNACNDHPGLDLIFALSTTGENFILRGKVCWSQRQGKDQLVSAMRVCNATDRLHSRFTNSTSADDSRELSKSLDKKREVVGTNIMRDNIRVFFEVIDECWNLRDVKYAERQPQLKGTFLEVLGKFFSEHNVFWQDKRLVVNAKARHKLAKFAIHDPDIARLCGAGGSAKQILYGVLLDHFNSGRRTGRLGGDEQNGDC